MAEVSRVPKWIMLDALKTNVNALELEKSDGGRADAVFLSSTDFQNLAQGLDEPFLRLSQTHTLTVGVGETIMAITLTFFDISTDTTYADEEKEIRYPIVDVDGNGEYFPDGGSIDTTEFEVYLNDL